MKKRINKTVVVITTLLTFGALGVTAKMTHMHHQKHHAEYMQGDNEQGHCFMWNGCGAEETAPTQAE
ncbi:MAG: hypothetical protein GQ574_00735 [Crocinitomix sp.]|nr:hypothetical protein [Crocinitomix sp.]